MRTDRVLAARTLRSPSICWRVGSSRAIASWSFWKGWNEKPWTRAGQAGSACGWFANAQAAMVKAANAARISRLGQCFMINAAPRGFGGRQHLRCGAAIDAPASCRRLATGEAPVQNFQMRFSCTPSKDGVPVAFSKSTHRMV